MNILDFTLYYVYQLHFNTKKNIIDSDHCLSISACFGHLYSASTLVLPWSLMKAQG